MACREYGSQQVEKYQEIISSLRDSLSSALGRGSANRAQLDEERSKSIHDLPAPQELNDYSRSSKGYLQDTPAKKKPQLTVAREARDSKRTAEKHVQYEIEVSRGLFNSAHLKNCLSHDGYSATPNKSTAGKYDRPLLRVKDGKNIVEKINSIQKRIVELESILENKCREVDLLEKEYFEIEAAKSVRVEEIAALEYSLADQT